MSETLYLKVIDFVSFCNFPTQQLTDIYASAFRIPFLLVIAKRRKHDKARFVITRALILTIFKIE